MGRALVSAPVMSSWRVPARGHTRLWQGFVAGEGPRGPGSRGHQVAHPPGSSEGRGNSERKMVMRAPSFPFFQRKKLVWESLPKASPDGRPGLCRGPQTDPRARGQHSEFQRGQGNSPFSGPGFVSGGSVLRAGETLSPPDLGLHCIS